MKLLRAVLAMLGAVSGPALAAHWTPRAAQIRALEARLTLPPGAAGGLERYDRHYSGVRDGRERLITGTLIRLDGTRQGRARIVRADRQPRLADGGCRSVRIVYAVETGTFRSVACGPALRPRAAPPVRTSGAVAD